jgi:hypothetical protein
LKKYEKTVIVPAPAGTDSGVINRSLQNYIIDRAQLVMPRIVDKLIRDVDWMNTEIHRGPITKRKRARSRK